MYFERGELTKISKLSGVPMNHLSDIIHRRRGVGVNRAIALEQVSKTVLGEKRKIPLLAWLQNKTTEHKAFI